MFTFKEKLAMVVPALFLSAANIPRGLAVAVANCAKSAPAMILVDVLNEASAMAKYWAFCDNSTEQFSAPALLSNVMSVSPLNVLVVLR